MIALFKKEINNFFSSLIGYIVIIIFLAVSSIFFWFLPNGNVFDYNEASMYTFFENAPYLFLLLIPAITMRSFAEEKSTGTLESLITKPISETMVILAKYFASLVLVGIAILPTTIYYFSLYHMGNPVGNIDTGSVIGSYFGLFLLASIYVAIGLFASSIANNQIVALLVAILLCLVLTQWLNWIGGWDKGASLFLLDMGVLPHYMSISRGVIDTRDLVYFVTANAFFLLATKTILQKRKW